MSPLDAMSEPQDRALPGHLKTLTKSSIASLLATGVEILVLLPLLVHVLELRHWLSYVIVQFIANAISFLLYKFWAFEAARVGSLRVQYLRQGLVFVGSLALNTGIASLLSYRIGLEPVLAFALSNLLVYLAWNYPGNRYFVFRHRQPAP